MSGYNKLFSDLNITFFDTTFKSTSRRLLQQASSSEEVNVRLKALGYDSPHLIMNFNYMYGAIVILILVFLIVYWVGKSANKEKVVKVASFFLKDIVFMLLFFCVNNMGFCLGLQFKYLLIGQEWTAPLYISWMLALLSMVILLVYLIYYMKNTLDFGDFSDKFKPDRLSQCHYPIVLIGRYLLNLVCGYFNDYPQLLYGILAY